MAVRTHSEHKKPFDQAQRKLKEQAKLFYSQHNVTPVLEKLLNKLFVENPDDVYGYMSEYFHGLSKDPVISGLVCSRLLDSDGGPAIAVTLHCTVNGKSQVMGSYSCSMLAGISSVDSTCSVESKKPSTDKTSEDSKKALDSTDSAESLPPCSNALTELVETIQSQLVPALVCMSPKDQQRIDAVILEKGRAVGVLETHPSVCSAISCAAATAAANLLRQPLFLHLANTFRAAPPGTFSMPLPFASVVAGGGGGKLRVKEFLVGSLPSCPLEEQLTSIASVHRELGRILSAKQGLLGRATLRNGAYCVSADKPESVLDLIRDAAGNAGVRMHREVSVMMDIGAQTLFDEEKGKYELVAGQFRTGEELVGLYATLLDGCPGLLGFIDPLHVQDAAGWKVLRERLGTKCLLVLDKCLTSATQTSSVDVAKVEERSQSGTGIENDIPQVSPLPTHVARLSCAALSPSSSMITDFCSKVAELKDRSNYLMLRAEGPQTAESIRMMADMAVAIRCMFVRTGGPLGITASVFLSRMLEIRNRLFQLEMLQPSSALKFSCEPLLSHDESC